MLETVGPLKAPEDLGLKLRLAISHESARRSSRWTDHFTVRWENHLRPMLLQVSAGFASALVLVGSLVLLIGVVAAPQAVLANDEPLGALTSPHYLYSAARLQPLATRSDSTIVVEADINDAGRVFDYTLLSGPVDASTAAQVRDELLLQVYEPARVFRPARARPGSAYLLRRLRHGSQLTPLAPRASALLCLAETVERLMASVRNPFMRFIPVFFLLFAVLATEAPAQTSSSGQSSSSSSTPAPDRAGPVRPRAGQPEAGGAAITLETSESLFDLASALNACGYDAGLANSLPVRAQVRADVDAALAESALARQSRDTLCGYVREHELSNPGRALAQYISLALYLSPPPELKPAAEQTEMPPDALGVINVLPLLRDLRRQGLASLDLAQAPPGIRPRSSTAFTTP